MGEEPTILERIRRGERIEHFETVRIRKDGSLVDISLTVSPVKPPTDRGFGTRVMDRMIRGQSKGEIRFDWRAEGLVCEITLPA
jgi:two-component system NtrC family sensor kinase